MDIRLVEFYCSGKLPREILISELFNLGFDGFEEDESGFRTYCPEDKYDDRAIESIIKRIPVLKQVRWMSTSFEQKNWNEEWERSYQPVILSDRYLVAAPFHQIQRMDLKKIIISPKMAFGTGHHATTQLMVDFQTCISHKDKRVLDFGAGTGILAIIAEDLGAKMVLAIENDVDAVECLRENIDLNHCTRVKYEMVDISGLVNSEYDIILANITRNVIIEAAEVFSHLITQGGDLVISGFYQQDEEMLIKNFNDLGFYPSLVKRKEGWSAMHFIRT